MSRFILSVCGVWLALATISCGAQAIGIVDVAEVSAKSKFAEKLRKEMQAFQENQQRLFDDMVKTRLLTVTMKTELEELRKKKDPNEADKARIRDLEDYTDRQLRRFRELEQKLDKTPAEQQEMQSLQQLFTDAEKTLKEQNDRLVGELKLKEQELAKKVQEAALQAVTKIAESKKLVLVVTKDAVLYGGTEITADVIAAIDKGL
jgi:Skp family chaperone for outer membrane proteins